MADSLRLIKKYPNRRLYDTQTSSYITLADVKELVLKHEEFQVVDAKIERGPDALDPAADHPRGRSRPARRCSRRRAVPVHPLLRQRDAGHDGQLPGEEHRRPSSRCRSRSRSSRGSSTATPTKINRGSVVAVPEVPGAGDAGPDVGLHGAEQDNVPADAGAAAEPDANMFHRVSRSPASGRPPARARTSPSPTSDKSSAKG